MKLTLPLRLILLAPSIFLSSDLHAAPLIRPNDVVAINGDSITAQQQYSVFIEEYLLACQPVKNVRSINFGVGGATAGYFDGRIASDILPFKPTVATACFGMNDGHYQPISKENQEAYRKAYTSALEKLKAGGVRTIIVGGPGCVDGTYFHKPEVTADGYNETLRDLGEIARGIAKQEGFVFADVHQAMMSAMTGAKAANASDSFFSGGDGVHPPPNGHLAMAYAFLKALGCDGAIGTITFDLSAGRAAGTPGHKVLSINGGSVAIESTRYPFCFVGDLAATKILPYLPFNQDLNRYTLIVMGLKTFKARVTWGADSKEFSAAELGKGINLAAEFLNNPFCERFAELQEFVLAKQGYEIPLAQGILHKTTRFKAQEPEQGAALDQIAETGIDLQHKLADLAAGRVVPVTHTISIEPVP
ncbi:MAG: SGNH/GDSL hydrolase family protein [Terrimicrobiaceae bacterium]|nr:SGNH/GDSL hydrolase family protein [Terrimicrobiaceae bacterium]